MLDRPLEEALDGEHEPSDGIVGRVVAQQRVAFELNDVRTLLELVAAGLGVSLVPPWASGDGLPIEFVRLRADEPRWLLAAVTRTGRRPSAAGRALLELLRG